MKPSVLTAAVALALAASAAPAAAQANGIRVTLPESGPNPGKLVASGKFTTAPNVKLEQVTITLLPAEGGRVLPPVATDIIDEEKKSWGPVPVEGIPNGHYVVLVEGHFSDKSSVLNPTCWRQLVWKNWGDPPAAKLTIEWNPGSPDNLKTPPQAISATGSYTGGIDAKKPALLYLIPRPKAGQEDMGGPATCSRITFESPKPGRWSAATVTDLPVGGYHVFGIVTGADGHRYCTSYANAYSVPKPKQ